MDSDVDNKSLVETPETVPGSVPAGDIAAGTVIADNFQVIQFVGHGATSNVWKAKQLSLERPVAIKILKRQLATSTEDYKRIRNEALSLRQLSHPNILAVYGMGEWNERFFLAVDFVDGKTLQQELAQVGPLPVERCLSIAQQCLAALAHAHEHGIVHRDIKPGNIMLTREPATGREVVKLVDFGIAKFFEQQLDAQITGSTEIIRGSPYYMSPEQCMGRKLDQRSDIYSFACVMHEMLCGKPPFDAETAVATMMMHASEPFPLIDRQLKVPSAVQVAILRAAAKDQTERLQSAQEFIDALNDTTSGIVAPGQPALTRRRPQWRGYAIAGALSFVAAAGLCAAVFHHLEATDEDQYSRMSRAVASGQINIDEEIKRIRSLSNKNLAARHYIDLIDVVSKLNEPQFGPKLSQVALSAAEYMSQVPGSEERLSMRSHIEILQTRIRLVEKSLPPEDIETFTAIHELDLMLSAYMGIADGRSIEKDRPLELGRLGYSRTGTDADHALKLMTLALAWSCATHNQAAIGFNCRFLGSYYLNQGKLEEADKYIAQAVAESPPNSHVLSSALFLAAIRAQQTHDLLKAKRYYEQGLAALKNAPFFDVTILQEAANNGSVAATTLGTKEQRYQILRESMHSLPPGAQPDSYGDFSNMLADAYYQNQDLPSAVQALDEGIALVKSHANASSWRTPVGRLEIHKADILRSDHRWKEAWVVAESARKNLQFADGLDNYNFGLIDSIEASCQMQLHQPAEARKTLQRALDRAKQVQDLGLRTNLLASMAARCSQNSLRAEAIPIFEAVTESRGATVEIRLQAYREMSDNLRDMGKFVQSRAACLAGQKLQMQHIRPADAAEVECFWEHKLAELEQAAGNFHLAAQHMVRSIELWRQVDPATKDKSTLADKLAMLGIFLLEDKRPEEAQRVVDESWKLTLAFPRSSAKANAMPLSINQIWVYQRIAHYYVLKNDWRKALSIDDSIKEYYRIPSYRTNMYFNGLIYISLLQRDGRTAEADALQKFYHEAGIAAR